MSAGDIIRPVADYRGSFLQNKTTTLQLKITNLQGEAVDPDSISVSIYNDNNPSIAVSSGIPEKIQFGFFIWDWAIEPDRSPGPYTAIWSYAVGSTDYTVQQGLIVITDSTNASFNSPYSDRIASIRASFDFHLGKAQTIPVYNEQAIVCDDFQTLKFTFPRWNQSIGTRIYRNGKMITGGITINYFKGEVIFDEPIHAKLDTVTADYNFRWFKDEELDRFMCNAVHMWNSAPPMSSRTLQTIQDRYLPAVLYGATVDALRRLILDLEFQEPREVFGGPEGAKSAVDGFERVKENYEKSLELLYDWKLKQPYVGLTKMISVPEYTLPGGRSRWFRYMMGGFNLS